MILKPFRVHSPDGGVTFYECEVPDSTDIDRLRKLLREIASLKRSRKNYAGKPSGTTATVNIPLDLLERIDAALSQSTGEPK